MNTDYTDLLWRRRWRNYGRFAYAAIIEKKRTDPDWTLEPEYAATDEWAARVAAARERVLADGRRQHVLVDEEECFA